MSNPITGPTVEFAAIGWIIEKCSEIIYVMDNIKLLSVLSKNTQYNE